MIISLIVLFFLVLGIFFLYKRKEKRKKDLKDEDGPSDDIYPLF